MDGWFNLRAPRLPSIMQTEVAECGLACVAMVANFYGFKTNLLSLRQQFSLGTRGATIKDIINISERVNLSSRVLRLELNQLKLLKKPTILHWNFNHFVVLSKVLVKGVVIHDPARGKVHLTWQQVSDSFTGIALELSPTHHFEKGSQRTEISVRGLIGHIKGLYKTIGKIIFVTLILQSLFLLYPYYIRMVIDIGVSQQQQSVLVWLFVGFLVVLFLNTFAQFIRANALLYLEKMLDLHVKYNIQNHLLNLPLKFFAARHVGDIKSRFEAFTEVQRIISRGFIAAIVDGLLSTVTLVIMFSYQPLMAAVTVAMFIAIYSWRFYLTGIESVLLKEQLEHQAVENSYFIETIRTITPIKCFAKENSRLSNWSTLFYETTNASVKREKIRILADVSHTFCDRAEYLIIVLIGANLMLANQFSIGMFLAFIAYRQQFMTSGQSLIEHMLKFRISKTYLQRMADIVLQETEASATPEHPSFPQLGSFEIKNLAFRYDDFSPWLYHDVSLKIDAGESVAMVGRSGLGKSTLLKVMAGLLTPNKGEILFGGMDIQTLGLKNYRSICGTVMQDDQLFNGSILDNISFYDPYPDVEKIKAITQGLAIWDDIDGMVMGLYTQIGDLGSSLSGGQKQRILLARALYAEPKILFLDEATSHLDAQTELKVNQYLAQERITRISIAHRKETINAADRVIDLAKLAQSRVSVA